MLGDERVDTWKKGERINDIASLLPTDMTHDFSGCNIIDTDDPNDLLLMGTEVSTSCMHVGDDRKPNKALLAYIMDGKNRIVAIKNSSGKIMARTAIRLLINEKKGEGMF